MKKFNYVYVTTDIKSGKQYIGDHSTNNLEDGYLGSGLMLFNRIQKYGKENFKKEILEFFDTKQEAFDAQEKWINEYNTLKPNGYNISPKGGHGVKGCISEETKEKLSKSLMGKDKGKIRTIEQRKKYSIVTSGENNGMFGKTHSNATKEKMRIAAKNRKINGMKNQTHTEESKNRISTKKRGQIPWNKKSLQKFQ